MNNTLVFDEAQLLKMKKVMPTMKMEGRSQDISLVCDDPAFKKMDYRAGCYDYKPNDGQLVGDKDELIRKLHLKQQFLNVE